MNLRVSNNNRKEYNRPVVTKVAVDTSLVLMAPSNPNAHHGHNPGTKGIDSKGLEEPAFKSPFGDKPFS